MICSFVVVEDEGSIVDLGLRSEVPVSVLCCLVGYLCEAGLVKRKILSAKDAKVTKILARLRQFLQQLYSALF